MQSVTHPRYITPRLTEALSDTPVICLLGPRQVGKTTLAKMLESDRAYINFDDSNLRNAAIQDPAGFVQGLPERVTLDEVQRVPEILLAIKASVDNNRKPGRFVLTGSANLLILPDVQDSLAGRMEVIYLQPLSEQEKQHSTSSLLERLISKQIKPVIRGEQSVSDTVAQAVVQGGYPEPNIRREARARQWHKQYVNAIIQRDVKDIAAIRDEEELLRLMKILALRTGSLLNISSLANELQLRRETVDKYLTILERLFLVRRLPAWHQNQAKRLVKAPKLHLIDSGLICALADLKSSDWHHFSNKFGSVLESFAVQQLICQSGWSDHDLHFSHYRDKDQVEVDLVIEQDDRVWGVEVKKAATIQPRDSKGLSKLADLAGDKWQGGILLYTGSSCLPMSHIPNTFAVPVDACWRE